MPAPEIITFGCRLNAFESEIIRRAAGAAGLEAAIIVNTCAVTGEAERQARQAIRRARREHPDARIIVTGCAATLAPQRYAAMPEVDRVLDNEAKLRVESYLPLASTSTLPCLQGEETTDTGAVASLPAPQAGEGSGGGLPRARAYLQVQQGCDHRCTFCIIPYARGASRSVPPGTVIAHAREMVADGVYEIVLTGVDLTAYGADLPDRSTLGGLARRLLADVPDLPRLRLSSLDPSEIDDELWVVFASEPRLMPHLHLSLQAGDDLILKRMKRRHNRARALDTARRARQLRRETAIGADLIAGFPTEDEAMFRNSLDLVAEMGISYLHVFPYSPRPGTPAARMPAVAPEMVRERAARLRAAGAEVLADELRTRVGTTGDVLIEKPGVGRADFYAPVVCPVGIAGIRRMRFTGVAGDRLVGELAA
ncbi:MAG TPA: tRNA (N(6)-L-threonylcarbamoyladenosine(37)-C(2))-methylthiotransferase MtaB [Stellaceae bacterium]|nr:tRNA (N(6)-L-threonylcarbamoyladenosine(37)-C(2))-methylthiotransferase MtaB [Stellaceae bacterium]